MARPRIKNKLAIFAELAGLLAGKLRPPLGVVLGSPAEVVELATRLPTGAPVCYQMDLYQAERLRQSLAERGVSASVQTFPDLWDLPEPMQTLLYPIPLGGERALKLDMIEQAYHALAPGGTFIVMSPYEREQLVPQALKKVFGKVHAPMEGNNALFWCARTDERPRRRHEIIFQVRIDADVSYRFVSRPGVFSYGHFDDGARALTEVMEVRVGERVLDVGCGIGTNGLLAARHCGPTGFVGFADSNVRAIALTELNATNLGVSNGSARATPAVAGFDEGSFDVVLANPPYYAQLSIAELFIERGAVLLRPGGRFYLVTKQVDQVYPFIEKRFGVPEMYERRGYIVMCCERR